MPQIISYLYTVLTAAAYFYFNWRYFTWVTTALDRPRMPKLPVIATYFINYLLFYICSLLELNLIINWGIFFILLFLETLLYSRQSVRNVLYVSLSGILSGLSINIFCRCIASIAIAQPLADFDNHITSGSNVKVLPVFLGFLLGGVLLHLIGRPQTRYLKNVRVLLSHPQHLSFQLEVMSGMFLYLFLNLLIYQSNNNGVLLKLWGIKSCVFSLVGTYLSMRYSKRMCDLSDYREKNRTIRLELTQKTREEDGLRTVAYRDALTGTYNRQYALETICRLLEQKHSFVLCFADLDHLKQVNDRCGHGEGDRYLVSAARALEQACRKEQDLLCRYGGDEFLLLFRETSAETIEERLKEVNLNLRETEGIPFSMSLSWGVVESAAGSTADQLIHVADAKMYRRKRAKAAGASEA